MHRSAHRSILALALLWLAPIGLGAPPTELGRTDFPTSGPAAAQEPFLEGLLLLHSFEYLDARQAFRRAQELAPDFAMAYWGEAMTYNHPIWLRENRDAAREVLARLAPTAEARRAKAPTAREKAYLDSLEVLFGEGDKRARDAAYAAAMGRLAAAYPDDLDAHSFHALALLGTCHDGRDLATYMRAAAIVEEVFARNPEHPGAAHYLIHAYDDAVHAPLGLRAARVYAKVAPAAAHALHMPSHIFLALGMWEETAASNVDSWEASEARGPQGGRNYHALWWLHYAHLQQGRFAAAAEQLAIITADSQQLGSEHARRHHALMRAAHIFESERWEELPAAPELSGLGLSAVANHHYAEGFAALRRGDKAAAQAALEAIRSRRQAEAEREREDAGGYTRVGVPQTRNAEVMEETLAALLALARGETEAAVAGLERATAGEDEMSFGYGPPDPVKPSHEVFGEVLLDLQRPAEARLQFEKALERAPRRALSLRGLLLASRAAGDEAGAAQTAALLAAVREGADGAPPGGGSGR